MEQAATPTRPAGDPIEALVNKCQSPLLRYALRLVRNEDAARDIVQEAFVRYLNQHRRNGGPCEPSNWLFRVTHNLAVDHIRRDRRTRAGVEQLDPAPAASPPDGRMMADESRRRVETMLARLPENQRAVVALKVFEEKKYREIADITGLSVSNVGLLIHRALKKLAKTLREEESI
jgi:RNA polymerase sigma-70 factor (ECF subfamily)